MYVRILLPGLWPASEQEWFPYFINSTRIPSPPLVSSDVSILRAATDLTDDVPSPIFSLFREGYPNLAVNPSLSHPL